MTQNLRKLVGKLRPIFLSSRGAIQKGGANTVEGACLRKVEKEWKEKATVLKKAKGNILMASRKAKPAPNCYEIDDHMAEGERKTQNQRYRGTRSLYSN